MKIAFVGVKRKYQELAPEYRNFFTQYHLELPYYYAKYGGNDVWVTTVDYSVKECTPLLFESGGILRHCTEEEYRNSGPDSGFDVIIHWRKWFKELCIPEALNYINCQDHSFSDEWKNTVRTEAAFGNLTGVLCFPTWHKENLARELDWKPEWPTLVSGLTLGVDTDTYQPSPSKDPRALLWASDPGRGLYGAVALGIRLWQMDHRYKLHVCYPDYVKDVQKVEHPGIVWHGNVSNGPKLWQLFNETGILPYTSVFKEPSSRAHRQAQAAASLVFYPPNMGTPSHLIQDGVNGIVSDPSSWIDRIVKTVESGEYKKIGEEARYLAIKENWEVQAHRFTQYMQKKRAQ